LSDGQSASHPRFDMSKDRRLTSLLRRVEAPTTPLHLMFNFSARLPGIGSYRNSSKAHEYLIFLFSPSPCPLGVGDAQDPYPCHALTESSAKCTCTCTCTTNSGPQCIDVSKLLAMYAWHYAICTRLRRMKFGHIGSMASLMLLKAQLS
jgi:hypothetical protein